MSVEAVKWAMYDAPHLTTDKGKPDVSARQVLGVLAEHADVYGADSYPGPPRIRYATGLSLRTIDRALDRLEHGGLITQDGVTFNGTKRWKLSLSMQRPEADWDLIMAEIDEEKRTEAARVKAFRDRQASIKDVDGTDSASVRTDSLSVRTDAESVSTDAVTPEPPEPPKNHQGTILGGTLPPDPLRTATPSAPRTEQTNSLQSDQDQPLETDRNSRPRTRVEDPARLLVPTASPATVCKHGVDTRRTTKDGLPRCKPCRTALPAAAIDTTSTTSTPAPGTCGTPGCHRGYLLVGDALERCTTCDTTPAEPASPRPPRGPAPDDQVWIAVPRKGVTGHQPLTAEPYTRCRRSMRTGTQLTAATATSRHSALWCLDCWPTTTEQP